MVNWHTRDFDLDPSLTYRICVSVGDVGLGYADVDLLESGGERQDVDAEAFVAVHDDVELASPAGGRLSLEAGLL